MVYPYMIGKNSWGSYNKTYQYSAGVFASGDPSRMALNSGSHFDSTGSHFLVRSYGQMLRVTYPKGRILFDGTDQSPSFDWCLPVLNYLYRADGAPLTGIPASYKELENGHVYYPAFRREAINRLSGRMAGVSPDLLAAAAKDLGGELAGGADFSCVLAALPRFPVTLKLWFPDDELGGASNILFDSTANHYLHTEDIAAIGELTVRLLIQHCRYLSDNTGTGVKNFGKSNFQK